MSLRKNHLVQEIHLNTLLDTMIIRPLCIKLPQMIGYVKTLEGNTTIFFKISDKQLSKKYHQTWKKVKVY